MLAQISNEGDGPLPTRCGRPASGMQCAERLGRPMASKPMVVRNIGTQTDAMFQSRTVSAWLGPHAF